MSDSAAAPARARTPRTGAGSTPVELRGWIKARREELREKFFRRGDPQRLLAAHATFVDLLLQRIWSECISDPTLSLVGVGGYGRGMLFPHSDVDVLVLLPDGRTADAAVERFVGMLWDCGLEPGHSVRTIAECVEEAAKDVTVDTSLIESRQIAGDPELMRTLDTRLREQRSVRAFFEAKFQEQKRRHERFQDAAYNLEPNIKESPGGLRDLQMVLWLARAAGLGQSWKELAAAGIITPREAASITINERVQTDLRIRLHYLAGRREDRIVFDHQIEIARQLKLKGKGAMAPSDLLMRRYYLAAKAIWRFNQILLANLFDHVTPASERKVTQIDEDFEVANFTLALRDEDLFERSPGKIFETFRKLQDDRKIAGLAANTLRALSRALPRIDRSFREEPENRRLFMEILRSDRLTWTLRRMSRYGVLGRYLPAFGRIVGQMQHDLFHVYTVDEHILMVLRNLRRFARRKFDHEYPFLSQLMQEFARPEVLYLAALFHDIAKGRGGDHSTLGMRDAARFCKEHGLSKPDIDLVTWLVEQHLVMSATAQKQDISDPEVISQFATLVKDERTLTAIYILTVADIRGTSPAVWNAWKGKLLEDLFKITRRVLRGEADFADSWVAGKKDEALRIFQQYVPDPGRHENFWKQLDDHYFQRFEANEIGWHTRTLWSRVTPDAPIVRARLSPIGEGLQVMVYAADQPGVFARITSFFERMQFDVAAAKIYTTSHGFALDSFQVLPRSRATGEHYRDLMQKIESGLVARIAAGGPPESSSPGRVSRWVKHFPIEPKVTITPDRRPGRWMITVSCADRPGLLLALARELHLQELNLIDARVTTLGARAEDAFVMNGAALGTPEGRARIAASLEKIVSA
ncbi:[protein-PII] uridylyltransferase [Usitatibacter palustris]|uniref:Bifunctional uridylyltransferase/uridylyl-removing enzyme n=1 Tax=Usitatibacter palustris TaxID=2732487 RepID=A0A6M4H6W2_9PROT|nr:[protein-PII] uridylyltransferase [Usitatibacter palustris]QJR14144.1 Bifunctional uridylyltransferase/uridylyl-removing enzyme [Usitatibacter palustris]